jgi:RNA polymerase sigma-70 factor (ECF subfamily)
MAPLSSDSASQKRGELELLRVPAGDLVALWERLRQGQPAARAQLYDEFQGLVRGLVIRLLGPDPDVDDLTQRIFVQLFDGLGGVRDPQALPAWVRMVTVNQVRDELRRRKLRRLFFGAPARRDDRDEVAEVAAPDAWVDPEARDTVRRVMAALDRLPVDERLAFQLRHVEDATLPEAAEACRCSLATFKRRLLRAEQRFAEVARTDAVLAARLAESPHWRLR